MSQTTRLAVPQVPLRLKELTLGETSFQLGVTKDDVLRQVIGRTQGSTIVMTPTVLVDETSHVVLVETHTDYANSPKISVVGVSIDPFLTVAPNRGSGEGPAVTLSSTSFPVGTPATSSIASISAPANWTLRLLNDFGGRVSLAGNQLVAAQTLRGVASGVVRVRAESLDGLEAVERSFMVSLRDSGDPNALPFIDATSAVVRVDVASGSSVFTLPPKAVGEERIFLSGNPLALDDRFVFSSLGHLVVGAGTLSVSSVAGVIRQKRGTEEIYTRVTIGIIAPAAPLNAITYSGTPITLDGAFLTFSN